jgi:CPA1 family monovalent cation:H+ antiporter
LLLVAGVVVVASLLQPVAERLRLPHSVLLAGLGIGLGLIGAFDVVPIARPGWFEAADPLPFDADTLLAIFLPLLLFQAGLTIDVRRMIDDLPAILLMAIVAVLICAAAVGATLSAIGGVSLLAALLVGAVIATTDPVAVVGIFREVGAPRRLSILVEGESLFNDAAAIALTIVLVDMIAVGGALQLGTMAWLFAYEFVGGTVLGFAGALVAAQLLRPLRRQPLAEIALTLALPYLLYVCGEQFLDVSGVVAVVVAALVIGARGRTNVTPQTWTALTKVWDQAGYLAAVLVFVFAAMIVPRLLAGATWTDLIALALLVVAGFAARAATLWGLLPALTAARLAQRVSSANKLVMLWGGLRGSVTLVLALAIAEDPSVPEDISRLVGVLATSFVLFTLLVNAPTLHPLMRLLGLDRLTPVDAALRDRTVALALGETAERLAETAKRHGIDETITGEMLQAYAERQAKAAATRDLSVLDPAAEQRLGLITLAAREEVLYLDHFARGTVSRRTALVLIAKAGRLRDNAKLRGMDGYLAAGRDSLRYQTIFRFAMWLQARFGIERLLAQRLADRFEALTITRMVLQDLLAFVDAKLKPLIGKSVCIPLREALEARLASCEEALESLRLQYPDYAATLEHRFLARAALRLEEREYDTLLEENVISSEIRKDLERRLTDAWRQVADRPRLDLGLDREVLVRQFPLFSDLDQGDLAEIEGLLKPRLVVPGERLITRGERGDWMAFLASGVVVVTTEAETIRLGRGDFFGELALLTGRRRSADVVAESYCRLLSLQGRDFRAFLKTHSDVREHIRAIARERMVARAL